MFLAFTELPDNTSDQEMLKVVMNRYKKEAVHPIQNLLGGELVRALLIQIQKLKMDTETAMLKLNQILKENEIKFATLVALQAFSLSLILLMFVRTWFKGDERAQGRGRLARLYRRLLLIEATRDSPPLDGVRGRNCIMKDMYGGTVAYESIQLSGVVPEGFYRVIVDALICDDV
ncbi:hypothetical protein GIB67_017136 [Kingdonia uniflora]|uniref:Uncharacterized protein n=1 Tax=Kingdonia uniflora TaxID=39325 RepID=A0A7J7M8V4_9MAGN|nr:hypothetical protein GIB67_020594 [Kingdonia uniflora]KAF6167420.1 hypothetical protein GIB67_017136 [Kingdonia uniflora]